MGERQTDRPGVGNGPRCLVTSGEIGLKVLRSGTDSRIQEVMYLRCPKEETGRWRVWRVVGPLGPAPARNVSQVYVLTLIGKGGEQTL